MNEQSINDNAVENPEGSLESPAVLPLTPQQQRQTILALLFAIAEPIPAYRLAEAAGDLTTARLRELIDETKLWLEQAGLPFRIEEFGGGFRLLSLPEYEPAIQRLQKVQKKERLSQAALETLSIIAYRQPMIKADIEAIRGVQVGPILRTLMEKRLIKVAGRAKVPGRPLQYATTTTFLDRFGLKSLDELPTLEELHQA